MRHSHHNTQRVSAGAAIGRLCVVSVAVATLALTGCSGSAPRTTAPQPAVATTTTAASTRACGADGALVLQGTRCVDECYDGWEPNVGGICVRAEPLATTKPTTTTMAARRNCQELAFDIAVAIEQVTIAASRAGGSIGTIETEVGLADYFLEEAETVFRQNRSRCSGWPSTLGGDMRDMRAAVNGMISECRSLGGNC